jgi:hypothetical protein
MIIEIVAGASLSKGGEMPCMVFLKRVGLHYLIMALVLTLVACATGRQPDESPGPPTLLTASPEPATLREPLSTVPGDSLETPQDYEPDPIQELSALPVLERPAQALASVRGELFATSGACTVCHTQMVDVAGVDVSTDRMWRATMMAHSARDPYWRASVRAEVINHSAAQEAIEAKCATCHMPMAWLTATHQGESIGILDEGFYPEGHRLYPFALDGVSCTLCHQIEDQNLGTWESFSGGYVVDTIAPSNERVAYGPYSIPPGQAAVMIASSGYKPLYAEHTQRSEICATCHNLTTDTLDANGMVVGQFHEQTIFLEWQHSNFAQTHACQDCHMPIAEGAVRLSITGSPPRQPFYQHHFVGGNVYMSQVLDHFAGDLGVTASSEQLRASQQLTLEQLQQRTISVEFESLRIENGELVADLLLNSQVGHKLPSGFPSRRVWVHFTVQDANGALLFDSGRANSDGSIQGNDNDQDPGKFESHYRVIDNADQVQIYEVIFLDVEGEITTGLLRGYEYIKDNRLLPAGFNKVSASPEIAVFGDAREDDDFAGGMDRLRYQLNLDGGQGPYTVTAQVLYQTIGYRWMENLRAYQEAETEQMAAYYDTIPNLPIVLAKARQKVGE